MPAHFVIRHSSLFRASDFGFRHFPIDMLRAFFLIFFLVAIAMVAFLGFRGQRSSGSPIELFPDMVRQMKVRAQAPSGFFADGRGIRPPVAGT
ncbi:MAG: hypothetical protein M3119_03150, partial [Verrucomicrobiota bacterium]|nr:hypothetical protein [Verrucomicrobiota bacterium]